MNNEEMQTIFSFGLTNYKYAMGSSEAMGMHASASSPQDADI
jgi:hypothetical protein